MLGNFLRGFGGPLKFSYVDSASGSTSLTIPASSQAGDICFLFNTSYRFIGQPSTSLDSVFTTIANDATSNNRWISAYAVLGSSDPGRSVSGMNYTSNLIQCSVFRPSRRCTPEIYDQHRQVTDSNPTSQTVAAGSYTAPLIVMGYANSSNSTTNFSSGSFDAKLTYSYLEVGYKIYNSSPSDFSLDMNDLGTNNDLRSFLMKAS